MLLRTWFWMIFLLGRQKSGVSISGVQRMLQIKSYKTAWGMAHKIRKALAERDARYQLAGLVEMDETYLGASRPGKRGRGAAGKTPVVLAVEVKGGYPGHAVLRRLTSITGEHLTNAFAGQLAAGTTVKSDGLPVYRVWAGTTTRHEPVPVKTGKNAVTVLPWVHVLITNLKGMIRGVYHGVSAKHLDRYLAEFAYRFNRRSTESQMFERMITACLTTNTITLAELTE